MPTLLIDGKWVSATGGQTIDVINPCDAKAYTTLDRGTAADIDDRPQAADLAAGRALGARREVHRHRLVRRAPSRVGPIHRRT